MRIWIVSRITPNGHGLSEVSRQWFFREEEAANAHVAVTRDPVRSEEYYEGDDFEHFSIKAGILN